MKKYQEFIESALGIGKSPLVKKPLSFMQSIESDDRPAMNTLKKAPKYNKPTGGRGPREYGKSSPAKIRQEFQSPSRDYPLTV